jgi:flagellar biosynthesis chaperone FliJ
MDQKTNSLPTEVIEKELGVGIQFVCSVGQGRQITMTAGIPLEWDINQTNKILDKLALAMDRQSYKYQLHDMRLQLEASEFQLRTNRLQKANYEQQQMADWEKGPKRGSWQPTESQRKQLQNWDTNVEALVEDVKKRRKQIEELEAQCR